MCLFSHWFAMSQAYISMRCPTCLAMGSGMKASSCITLCPCVGVSPAAAERWSAAAYFVRDAHWDRLRRKGPGAQIEGAQGLPPERLPRVRKPQPQVSECFEWTCMHSLFSSFLYIHSEYIYWYHTCIHWRCNLRPWKWSSISPMHTSCYRRLYSLCLSWFTFDRSNPVCRKWCHLPTWLWLALVTKP